MGMGVFAWLKIILVIIGVGLILFGVYLYFQQWSHVNMKTREYSYISEIERDKRSVMAGASGVILIMGISFIISVFSAKPVTLQSIILFLALGAFSSPLAFVAMMIRMRRDLAPYTKMKDDVVFLDEDKSSKN